MEWIKYVIDNYLKKEGGEYNLLKTCVREKIHSDIISGGESEIRGASNIVLGLDNLNFSKEQVDEIETKCSDLPKSASKSIRDYRQDANAAVMLLKHFNDGATCKCGLYEKWSQFIPEKEIEIDYLEQLAEPTINHIKYQIEYDLACKVCNTKWQSNKNDGYHYPIYEWIRK